MTRRPGWIAALLVLGAVLAEGCAPSVWERREAITSPPARFLVPRLFEPLLPGSIYPNRRRPVPARGRPAVLVVGRIAKEALVPLGERGIVVLALSASDVESVKRARDLVRMRDETRSAPIGLWLLEPTPALLRFAVEERAAHAATVLFDFLPPAGAGNREAASRPFLVLLRTPANAPGVELSARLASSLGASPVEKWYAGASFPKQAYRDAAEWTAARLGITPE